jgi:hypothetical protein
MSNTRFWKLTDRHLAKPAVTLEHPLFGDVLVNKMDLGGLSA